MSQHPYNKEWDDLDIYDREAANIRRELRAIDLKQWCQDLHDLDPDLYDKLYENLRRVKK